MQSSTEVLLRSIVIIIVQQICARVVPFLLHTLAKKSLDPASASVRQPVKLPVASFGEISAAAK
jgi:hypothetical protein